MPGKFPSYSLIYQEEPVDEGSGDLMRLINSCRNMMWTLRYELEEIGITGSRYMDTFLISIYGGTKTRLKPLLWAASMV